MEGKQRNIDVLKEILDAGVFSSSEATLYEFINQCESRMSRSSDKDNNDSDDTEQTSIYAAKDIKYAKGIIDWDHLQVGGRCADWGTVAKMDPVKEGASYNSFMFTNLPLKSKLFIYDVAGTIEKKDPSNAFFGCINVFKITDATLIARPFTREMLDYILDLIKLRDESLVLSFLTHDTFLLDKEYKGLPIENTEITIKLDDFISVLRDVGGRVYMDRFMNNEEIKLYFHNGIVNTMSKYYNRGFITNLNWDDIPLLEQVIKQEPHTLCFRCTNTFSHKIPKKYATICEASFIGSSDGLVPLYELGFNEMFKAFEDFSPSGTSAFNIACCLIYDELRIQANEGKHSYTQKDHLAKVCLSFESVKITHKDVVTAFEWLERNEVIVHDEEQNVFIKKLYMAEQAITIAFEYVIGKAYLASYIDRNEQYDSDGMLIQESVQETDMYVVPQYLDVEKAKSHRGFKLCSEQAKAFQTLQCLPILVIDGPGGSGTNTKLNIDLTTIT